jgi:hypothetical protein
MGMSTQLQSRKTYSNVKMITENVLKRSRARPYWAATSSTVSAAKAAAFKTISVMMKALTK